eukprot:2182626-Rhodomonas_salina.1
MKSHMRLKWHHAPAVCGEKEKTFSNSPFAENAMRRPQMSKMHWSKISEVKRLGRCKAVSEYFDRKGWMTVPHIAHSAHETDASCGKPFKRRRSEFILSLVTVLLKFLCERTQHRKPRESVRRVRKCTKMKGKWGWQLVFCFATIVSSHDALIPSLSPSLLPLLAHDRHMYRRHLQPCGFSGFEAERDGNAANLNPPALCRLPPPPCLGGQRYTIALLCSTTVSRKGRNAFYLGSPGHV